MGSNSKPIGDTRAKCDSAAIALLDRAALIIENIAWTNIEQYVPGNIDYELDRAAREIRALVPSSILLPSADDFEKMAILGSENQCRDMLLDLSRLQPSATRTSGQSVDQILSEQTTKKASVSTQRRAFELAYSKVNGSTPSGGWNDFNESLCSYDEPDTQAAWELCQKFSALNASHDRNTK